MSMQVGGSGRQRAEINVTPLIDVLLVLLIIFIIITPLKTTGENALIPRPAQHDAPPDPLAKTIVLQLTNSPDGQPLVRINDEQVRWEDLRPRLQAIYADRVERVIFVSAESNLQWDQIAQTIDVAHSAGVYNVGLLTERIRHQ